MGTYILISIAVVFIWIVKDRFTVGSSFDISKTWPKYAGALLAGLLYIFLKGWNVFQYVIIISVVVLVGTSFDTIMKFFTWLVSKFKK